MAPTPLVVGFDLMGVEDDLQGNRRSLIEENTQSDNLGRIKALGGVVQDGTHLLVRYAREPIQELGGLRSVLEVLEQCVNRHAGTSENPLAAHAPQVSLNR